MKDNSMNLFKSKTEYTYDEVIAPFRDMVRDLEQLQNRLIQESIDNDKLIAELQARQTEISYEVERVDLATVQIKSLFNGNND